MKFPAVFICHGGGPMPLLGLQPDIAQHLTDVRHKWLPAAYLRGTTTTTTIATKESSSSLPPATAPLPSAIVIFSGHWESDPIRIVASAHPSMVYDYYGFPQQAYEVQYKAPGNPALARKIHTLLTQANIPSILDTERGYDHGVFVPLLLMYPEANIPVVQVSLHADLSVESNLRLGQALHSLREEENVLLIGSGYSYHNMNGFMHPTAETTLSSRAFNEWLKQSMLGTTTTTTTTTTSSSSSSSNSRTAKLLQWESAPSARKCHPRAEHLAPLFCIVGAVGDDAHAELIYDATGNIACSAYMFQ